MGAGPLPADIMAWMGMDEAAAYALLEPVPERLGDSALVEQVQQVGAVAALHE
jgi:hypothetical protein